MQSYIFTRDVERAWAAVNPILLKNHIGRVEPDGRFKVGDGVSRWNDLPFTDRLPEQIPLIGLPKK